MKILHVNTKKSYDVLIGKGLLSRIGSLLKQKCVSHRCMVVSDDLVYALYGEELSRKLIRSGFQVDTFVFTHGEQSKNLSTYSALLCSLSERDYQRNDAILALGGGVVGDVAGFAAATYLRGIAFIQIPTTVLSCVDSSVGGKTGINLDGVKNRVGCFYQPDLVLCDVNTWDTLPENEILNGLGEVVKVAILSGQNFLRALMRPSYVQKHRDELVERCLSYKIRIVEEDEKDNGCRKLLNFGHTIGHAMEEKEHYGIPHGLAVAYGIAAITRCACAWGYCSRETCRQIMDLLDHFQLLSTCSCDWDSLIPFVSKDKKASGDEVTFVVPKEIGQFELVSIRKSELRNELCKGDTVQC